MTVTTGISGLNPVQQQAVETRVPNVLVSAGAGSGKTRVLTQRYLHLLEALDYRIDQILTLTFTRKAAQEMRERIARKLDELGKLQERHELMRAPIGTIHSFCERILRDYALEAGIDPNFRLLDEAEAQTMQEKALDLAFDELWAAARGQQLNLGRLLLEYPYTPLRESLLGIYRTARTQGLDVAALAPAPGLDVAAAVRNLCSAVEALLALPGTPTWQQNLATARAAYDELRNLLQSQQEFTWETFYRARELEKALTPRGGKEEAAAAREAIRAAMDGWLGACLDMYAMPYLRAFADLLHHAHGVYSRLKLEQSLLDFEDLLLITRDLLAGPEANDAVCAHFHRRFRQMMVDEFQDTNPLQFSIIRALQGDGHLFVVGDVKQAIYRFMGSDIHVFLEQEARIAALGAEQGERLPMSANYRTRPEVLAPINALFARLWAGDGEERAGFAFEALTAGQEFLGKEIPAIELAFWPGEDGGGASAFRDHEAPWIARRILQLTGRLGEDALPLTGKRERSDDPLYFRPADFGDVIVLFRASSDIPRYEDAFRQAGVPYYVVSGRGFYQTREVQDVVHMLRVLDNPLDDFSLAAVLRSPLAGVSDDALFWLSRDWSEWAEGAPFPAGTRREPAYGRLWENVTHAEPLPALAEADRQALAAFRETVDALQRMLPSGQPLDLIDALLARTSYGLCLLAMDGGEQRYANIRKLREVAADFQARGIFDLSDFQRYLTQLEKAAPREASAPLDVEGSPVVRLMTVHAAKGLEAPIVFLADCGRSPQRFPERFLLAPKGLTCQLPTPEDEWESTASYAAVVERNSRDDRWEGERLLYVAMTRAREHLICSGFTKYPAADKVKSYADLLANLLGVTEAPEETTDLPVEYDGQTGLVRVWSPEALSAVEALQPPVQEPTLWDQYAVQIAAGQPLPVVVDDAELEQFTNVVVNLRPLPAGHREGPLRVGVNRAICYDKCPRQFWFRYLLRQDESPLAGAMAAMTELPEDDEAERVDNTEFGQLLHGVLQRAVLDGALLDQAPALLAQVAEERNTAVTDADRARLDGCLRRLMAMPLYAELGRAEVIHRELRFLAVVDGVLLPGIIDLMARVDGNWWILDYKTGYRSADHMRQVTLYALGVQQALGILPTRVKIAYLDEDVNVQLDEPVSKGLIDHVRQLVQRMQEGLSQDDYRPLPEIKKCEHCPYTGACPEGREVLTLVGSADVPSASSL